MKTLSYFVRFWQIRKLAKNEKEWRQKLEEERLAKDPVTRFKMKNKKLIANKMRLEGGNEILAQQLLTRQLRPFWVTATSPPDLRPLGLKLAQTKLALVETKCKNQDLTESGEE